ncbi:MAG: ferrous iron transport protein B [Coriobacteriia bacterium]
MAGVSLAYDEDPVGALEATRGSSVVIALVGNPNVGKSSIFNRLTGVGVETAHYPGTTQGVNIGESFSKDRRIVVLDLPGTYTLAGEALEQQLTRRALLDLKPDVVVVVADATNLERNLFLAVETIDVGTPVVIALNLVDEAEHHGLSVDRRALEDRLGVPVVETVATTGAGTDELVRVCLDVVDSGVRARPTSYGEPFEALLAPVIDAAARLELPERLNPRTVALLLVEGAPELLGRFLAMGEVAGAAAEARAQIAALHNENVLVRLARERHALAGAVATAAVTGRAGGPRRGPRDAWTLTTSPWTGVPVMVVVLGSVFGFLFIVGDVLARAFSAGWQAFASPMITRVIESLVGTGTLAAVLRWGFDAGVEASLAIGLPYILTFYVILAVLEDSGYLNSLAFLADRVMHRLGLHGRAILPLVAAAGCNVPAIVSLRRLPSKRERFIASVLVSLVPCSARTAVVLGAVGHYIGWQPALGVFAVVAALGALTGLALNKMIPGRSSGLVMEMFPFRPPSVKGVLSKAWAQFREFLLVATPIVIVGSLVLGGLYETGVLWRLTEPLEPVVVAWLGLPPVAGLTLLFGTLRKELALQLLVAMAVASMGIAATQLTSFMTPTNLFVYALVNTIAVPCVSTIAVLARQQGWLRTAGIVGFTLVAAIVMGGISARILPLIGWR